MTDRDRVTPIEAHRRAEPPRPEPALGLRRVPTDPTIVDQVPTADVLNRPRFDRPRPPPLPTPSVATRGAPTPAAGTVAVGAQQGPPSSTLPPLSEDSKDAQIVALRARAEAAESAKAEFERRERVAAETQSPATFPPKIEQRRPSPPAGTRVETASTPPDAAIGKSVRYLLGRLWPFFLAAAGIGGGVTAVAKPSVDPAKADATLANTEALRRDLGLMRTQLNGALDREAASSAYVQCLAEQQAEYFAQLSPAPDKMGSAAPLKPFVDRCRNRRP